jgi:hypothetical protein
MIAADIAVVSVRRSRCRPIYLRDHPSSLNTTITEWSAPHNRSRRAGLPAVPTALRQGFPAQRSLFPISARIFSPIHLDCRDLRHGCLQPILWNSSCPSFMHRLFHRPRVTALIAHGQYEGELPMRGGSKMAKAKQVGPGRCERCGYLMVLVRWPDHQAPIEPLRRRGWECLICNRIVDLHSMSVTSNTLRPLFTEGRRSGWQAYP